MKNLKHLTILIILSLSFNSHAKIVDHGNYITDTVAGIDWLKLSNTEALSYDQVSAQLGTDGQFEGWLFANKNQLETLFDNAGGSGNYSTYITLPDGSVTPNNTDNILPVLNMWGNMGFYSYAEFRYGQPIDDKSAYGTITIPGTEGFFSAYPGWATIAVTDAPFSRFLLSNSFESASEPYYEYISSSALVRPALINPVPVPTSIWFFGTGIIALLGMSKSKKQPIG